MKQILITVILLFGLLNISKNAYSIDQIILTNCPDFNGECMGLRFGDAIIDIYVNEKPEMQGTNWSAHFSTSTSYDPIFWNNFRPSSKEGYTHEYSFSLPVDPDNNNGVAFVVFLMDASNVRIDKTEVMSFQICENTSWKMSANHNQDSGLSKNSENIVFNPSPLLNLKVDDNFNIFPNPFIDDFTVQYNLTKNGDETLEIFNIRGDVVREVKLSSNGIGTYQKSIRNIGLIKGVYFCRIKSAESQKITKIIKTN